MNKYIFYQLPIEDDRLDHFCSLLRTKNIICTIYDEDIFDPYSIEHYLNYTFVNTTKFIAIFDTNIVVDLLNICKGEKITINDNLSDTKLTSCALLVLLICFKINVEPFFGIHEIAQNDNYVNGHNNISLFRAMDNINPLILSDLIEGRIESITNALNIIDHKIDQPLDPFKWHFWFLPYTCILKIIIIEKTMSYNFEKMITFIDWMWHEFIFCAAATVFAMIYFSNNRLPKMLKNILHSNYDDSCKTIKNIAWDLCAIEYWVNEAHENHPKGTCILFCTQDKMLKEISKYIVVSRKTESAIIEHTHKLYIQYWGKVKGEKLYQYYQKYFQKIDSIDRENRMQQNKTVFANLYKLLEEQLVTISKS